MNVRLMALLILVASMFAPASATDESPSPSPAPSPTASMSATPPAEDPAVTTQAKAQFAAWQSGKIDRSLYDDEMNKQLTDAIVTGVSQQLAALGAPTKFTFVTQSALAGSQSYLYGVETPKTKLQMLFSLDAQHKISGIVFRPAR